MSETVLQIAVADYLTLQYPDVLFHSDYGSGVKLTLRQAAIQKRQNGGRKSYPDMFIAQPAKHWVEDRDGGCHIHQAHGLYLELKKDGEKLYPGKRAKNRFKSKDGKEYKTEHLMEQADCLYDLRQRGYCAEFAIGFNEAKRIIDEYLGRSHN